MPRVDLSGGVYSTDYFIVDVGDAETVYVTVTLNATGPGAGWETGWAAMVTYGEGGQLLWGLPNVLVLPYTGTESAVFSDFGDADLAFWVEVYYGDEGHDWTFSATYTTLDTLPLIFDPQGTSRFETTETDSLLITDGLFHVYHVAADVGLRTPVPLDIDLNARRVTFYSGSYEIVDVNTGAALPNTITFDGEVSAPFDDVYVPASLFTLATPLGLGVADITIEGLSLDDRGVVFGFYANLPDAIGGLTVLAEADRRGHGLLAADGAIVGRPSWDIEDKANVLLLDLFRADVTDAVAHWDAGAEEWRWTGGLTLRDLLGVGSRLDMTGNGASSFFANAAETGFRGTLGSADTHPLEVGGGYVLTLDDATLWPEPLFSTPDRLEMDAEIGLRFGRQWTRFDSGLCIEMDAATQAGIATSFAYAAFPAFGEDPLATGFSGLFVHDLDATISSVDTAPELEISAILGFDDGAGGAMLSIGTVLTANAHGLSGNALLTHQSVLLELVASSSDLAFDTRFGTLSGSSSLLRLNFDILGAALDATVSARFLQRDGAHGSFTMQGSGEVTALPGWLAALLGVSDTLAVDFDAQIEAGDPANSHITITAPLLGSGEGHADFGLRYWFDDRLELLGGLTLGDADLGGGGAGGGPFTFTLAGAAPRLVLRAEGDVDAADALITLPDGMTYGLAQFAAAGITVLEDDAGGLSLLVANAPAGTWTLTAPGATGFSGIVAQPPLTLTVTAITTPDGPGLRVVSDGATTFHIFDDTDGIGFDGAAVFSVFGDADGVVELTFADLGLAPGTRHFHVTAEAPGLLPAEAYLAGPVTITGVADLTIAGEMFLVDQPIVDEASTPPPHHTAALTITNTGDARAVMPELLFRGGPGGSMALPDIAAGETLRLLVDLGPSPVAYLTVEVTSRGYESDLSDNSVTLSTLDPMTTGAYPDVAVTLEEQSVEVYVLTNDRSAVQGDLQIVRAPLHGTAYATDFYLVYTPAENFAGQDVLTYSVNGFEAQVYVTVQNVNDAPTLLEPLAFVTAFAGVALDVSPAQGLVVDIDDTELFYQVTRGDGQALPDWLLFDPMTGRLRGTPGAGDLGTLPLTLMVYDAAGGSASDDFELTVAAAGGGTSGPDILFGTSQADMMHGLGGDDRLFGRAGSDTLLGGDGADRLDGGQGADSMAGGADSDTYVVDDAGDVVTEAPGEGIDRVIASLDWTLAAELERLSLSRTADLNGTGNGMANLLAGNAGANRLDGGGGNDGLLGGAGNDTLLGGDGADRLDGGLGADSMAGGADSDTYVVDDAGDVVSEAAGGGYDRVVASLDWTLGAEIERLSLAGTAALTGSGNALANRLDGNAGANLLDGGDSNDTLLGGAGDDTLLGGQGADRLDGGTGADSMAGSAGSDSFVFRSATDAVGDVIADFNPAESDRIDLRPIDADQDFAGNQAFTWLGDAAFTGTAGELRFDSGILEGDVDGDGTADFQIALNGVAILASASVWL